MTIVYDASKARAYENTTGLSVGFVRHGILQEVTEFFNFTANGASFEFPAAFDNGWFRLDDEYPELSPDEKFDKLNELSERNYSINMDFYEWNKLSKDKLEIWIEKFYEIFIELEMKRLNKNIVRISSRGTLLPKCYWRNDK